MKDFWQRVRCMFAGHPITVSEIEDVGGGQLYAVRETCACGNRAGPVFPGAFFKAQHENSLDNPTEFEDFF